MTFYDILRSSGRPPTGQCRTRLRTNVLDRRDPVPRDPWSMDSLVLSFRGLGSVRPRRDRPSGPYRAPLGVSHLTRLARARPPDPGRQCPSAMPRTHGTARVWLDRRLSRRRTDQRLKSWPGSNSPLPLDLGGRGGFTACRGASALHSTDPRYRGDWAKAKLVPRSWVVTKG